MRGWVVKYRDNPIPVTEWGFGKPFSQLPDQDLIEAVALVFDERSWVLRNKRNYFSAKAESALYTAAGEFQYKFLENRTIGYWEDGKRVRLTVNEHTGEMYGPYTNEE
jgi:hypothetical protein